ncbi:hypothetical protein IEO21_10376 [Rhodonia placenta]|uniref:Uncharacterized protein n=1 Tax=Rhodonia placenta TaxID=104341 RepID=A0A8H7NSN1_9APHY|nr:hypothetical protein IEO21_10376 [Postia placenta]
MFTMWEDTDKHATAVEHILDISWARRPELNSFFSARIARSVGQHQHCHQKGRLSRQLLRLWETRVPPLRVPQL